MPLLAYGINHESAPIAIRERLAFDPKAIPNALKALTKEEAISEAIILSTCNRTEIYANLTNYFSLQNWLQQQKKLSHLDLSSYAYAFHEVDAICHIMRVASGINSMVLGEPQIFGQLKQAYQIATDTDATGQLFNLLFPTVFETSKHIRSNTAICKHPVSLAFAITQLAKKGVGNLSDCNALLIGSGEMIELIATHLHQHDIKQLVIANRTLEKTAQIASNTQAKNVEIRCVPEQLIDADIVVTATRSQLPIIGKGTLETVLKARNNKPLLLFDLAVPRDIEPEAATLDPIQLFNIDHLQEIISENLQNRKQAAQEAEKIITEKAAEFLKQQQLFQARSIITDFRTHLEKMRDNELNKALSQLQNGIDPQIVIEQFGRSLVNKILHQPTVNLREAASTAQHDTLKAAKQLFELE